MANNTDLVRTGKVWKFGDLINTDLILPQVAFRLPEDQQVKYIFSAIRPGWSDLVGKGDLLVGGSNFGMGSSRPIGALLRTCGIEGMVANSINGLCMRTLVNGCLPAIGCKGVADIFEEGDTATINFSTGAVENVTRHRKIQGTPMPKLFTEIVGAGGVVQMLINEGWIEAEKSKAVS